MKFAAAVVLLLSVTSTRVPAQMPAGVTSCETSPVVRATAPSDPSADPVGPTNWYMNADRTIWVAVPDDGWPSGGTLHSGNGVVKGQKTYWVRPAGTDLVITGRRTDAASLPVEAHVPCCYPTGFQIVALYFPAPGCWEVSAKSGNSDLHFVTRVER